MIAVRERTVFFTTRFNGVHCWPGAPEETYYLRTPHRHVFHVRVDLFVTHDNRDIEFIAVKSRVERWLQAQPEDLGTTSCEMLCDRIAMYINTAYGDVVTRVEVSEDGENGAVLLFRHD